MHEIDIEVVFCGEKWWKGRRKKMFMGEYEHSLDAKGRLFLPAKFREQLGECFVITKGLDECLFIYTQAEWKLMEEKLHSLPLAKKEARAFVRFFFSGATELEADKQGRILLPQNLRTHASLEKEIVVVGVASRIEVWDKVKWQAYAEASDEVVSDIAEELADLGI